MSDYKALSVEERHFLTLVNRAVSANPFSEERTRIDNELNGKHISDEKQRIIAVMELVAERFELLSKKGRAHVDKYRGTDRQILKNGLLFHFFYRYLHDFDNFIIEQNADPQTNHPVGFAKDAFTYLHRHGIREEASHFFSICFQLRRAFFFIRENLVGRSPAMIKLRENLWNNVFTSNIERYNQYLWDRMEDFSTLILGETGTGKGTAAVAIGKSGYIPFNPKTGLFKENFCNTFVSLNLSQFPETLIESELFGHKKGAFTGARDDHQGILRTCPEHGSIFLDEIGEVSIPVQIKLLKVIQERIFTPIGSHTKERFHGRIIAATNKSLNELRSSGKFRDDFYYRLCSDVIEVPPLRERLSENLQELDDLLSHTLQRITGTHSPELNKEVKKAVLESVGTEYHWPGNVRELEQCIRRILLKNNYEGDYVTTKGPAHYPQFIDEIITGNLDTETLISKYCRHLYDSTKSFAEVARITNLDWRTVKKYLQQE